MSRLDMTGRRFGRLTVVKSDGMYRQHIMWLCRCDCGHVKRARAGHLRDGRTRSCGCLNSEMTTARFTTHGMKGTPEYKTWINIRQRCDNPKHISYRYYGAMGVKVCDRWQDFDNFFMDMGARPQGAYSIDRIDPWGDYTPANCRWATVAQQNNNRRNSLCA